ncbi:MAG: hypothetical protein V7K54_27425 [Nostoc sp.]
MPTVVTELCRTPTEKQATRSVSKSCVGYAYASQQGLERRLASGEPLLLHVASEALNFSPFPKREGG